MDDWSKLVYGDPCRECGYSWTLSIPGTGELVGSLPTEYRDTIGDASGSERHPDLEWSATAYVCHVADNLRIMAERLQGVMRGDTRYIGAYDENSLAEARGYDSIDLQAALWSLTRSANDWVMTMTEAQGRGERGEPVTWIHQERGEQELVEIARANCHDAVHHLWDIRRILGYEGRLAIN
jgi:hypothetical protein